MSKNALKYLIVLFLLTTAATTTFAQGGILRRLPRGGGGAGGSNKDTLQHRDNSVDSITISFRYLDSTRMQKFDSSIYDFTKRFPVPWYNYHLGNIGNATHSMIFSPIMRSGWDMGFHQYDDYNLNDYETRFYNTTRPLTEIQYQIGSRLEQLLGILQTQNITPNWNASFQYRLVNSPGLYLNQNTNHNNYRFGSWFQSKNRRYQNLVIVAGNKLASAENGGIVNEKMLDSNTYSDRSSIPTKLGANTRGSSRNFFANNIGTGTLYTNASFLMRQQYDFGQKDSIVTDSTVIPLFYPRLRLEHTINYKTYNYRFIDVAPDSAYYQNYYGETIDPRDTIFIKDQWHDLTNDFSFYTFPDAKNSQQFFKAGASFQALTGIFDTGTVTNHYHNFLVHGEYRNKTRNQKWDVEAFGHFYVNGMNAGDYDAHISLKRQISKKLGFLEVGFSNVNRTPSFVFDSTSSFYKGNYENFKKENTTAIFGSFDLPQHQLKLTGTYRLVSNFTYFKDYKQAAQYPTVFNGLEITAQKQFRLGGNWHWRTWIVIQQLTGNPPVNVPFLLTRNQVGYDGNLGFKNLFTSFGLEFRYYTPYKADRYSPVIGQFFNQEDTTVHMRLPEIAAYFHFRIRTFTSYIRLENLNSFDLANGGFTRNNIVSPGYPYPGMWLRIGVYWDFIN
jgi:hypothetical protein